MVTVVPHGQPHPATHRPTVTASPRSVGCLIGGCAWKYAFQLPLTLIETAARYEPLRYVPNHRRDEYSVFPRLLDVVYGDVLVFRRRLSAKGSTLANFEDNGTLRNAVRFFCEPPTDR